MKLEDMSKKALIDLAKSLEVELDKEDALINKLNKENKRLIKGLFNIQEILNKSTFNQGCKFIQMEVTKIVKEIDGEIKNGSTELFNYFPDTN